MNILIVDDEAGLRSGLIKTLTLENFCVFEAENREQTFAIIQKNDIHLVLLDLKLKGENGYDLLLEIKQKDPLIAVIIVTGYGDVESAVNCMRAGAINYLTKPLNYELLVSVLKKEAQERLRRLENISLRETLREKNCSELVESKNPQILKNEELIQKIKDLSVPVLILGETGTGKELTAKKIHYSGRFRDEPFIGLNCAALNENLLESELFGHEKGAFTGAYTRKLGRFELAQEGTLFLDEIGDMSLPLQAKLLRVLQEKSFERVGGTQTIKSNCRIIAATNKDIQHLINSGSFRSDLYFRLSVVTLFLPPLRERREDIPALTKLFITEANLEFNKNILGLSCKALEALLSYHWPGNIRQLKNVITHAVLLAETNTIEPKDLSFLEPSSYKPAPSPPNLRSLLQHEKNQREQQIIQEALQRNKGNITHTAKELGISRKTLYEKLKYYKLEF